MIKKILFLLITLTTFANVSYASFPVKEAEETEIIKVTTSNNIEVPRNNGSWIYGMLSILFLLLALILAFIIIVGMLTMSPLLSGPAMVNYISIGILSFIAAIVLGIIAIVKK
ncbi:MAG: hypothetical protein HN522_06430 [Flavobacteriales bacterium]|jgi:hypothetical protein|nr:hypothetical protein [Flavobacteriales bacterium]MBT5090392.1 hypothetical protein [Flavobacteriales bacterium]MBT5750022.1 hypothetical protein [Flavobacteriales bacterium]